MFILTTIQDLVQISPTDFDKPSKQAIKDAINTKYSNKIIQNIGLCVCLFDLLQTSEGLIGHGTGLVNVNAEFRMLVFRPFRGEILYARIKSADEDGITLHVDFTSEIFVPGSHLPANSSYDRGEKLWIWKTFDEESGQMTEMFFDKGEPVLFRVEQEIWIDQKPTVVQKDEAGNIVEHRDTSWRIIGSMAQPGLGPNLWWGIGPEAEGGEENGEEDMEE